MYEEVYTALGWERFVDACAREGKRFAEAAKAMAEQIHAATGQTFRWYCALDGRDLPVTDEADFGRYQYYILRDSTDWCYAIETQDFDSFATYGKRKAVRLPIGKGIRWWDDSDCRENLTAEEALDWLRERQNTSRK